MKSQGFGGELGRREASLGETLAIQRRSRRLSIIDLAARAGISRQHIWRIEKGIVDNPTRDMLTRLAAALSVGREELVPAGPAPDDVMNTIRANATQMTDEDMAVLRGLAARLRQRAAGGLRQRAIAPKVSPPCASTLPAQPATIPDDIKVIAQFIAEREGHAERWHVYTREAFDLRRELKARAAWRAQG